MSVLLIALQAFQVMILWLHDWVPLGRLTDIAAVHANDTRSRVIKVTLIQSVPYTIGLIATVAFARTGHPRWIWSWLWISYTIVFAGELRAWRWPYLNLKDVERAKRYRAMFSQTCAFLPIRNGMVPNTLHTILHSATLATLIVLAYLSFGTA